MRLIPVLNLFFLSWHRKWSLYLILDMLFQAQLTKTLAEPVEALLDSASEDTWPAIRNLLLRETKAAISGLESALAAFELDEATEKELLRKLENHGRSVVESKAKEEAGRVLIRMKDR
jgi:protein SEY1